jgi:ABC-type transport system involved in multi-copper enzyme maturation permease subunit
MSFWIKTPRLKKELRPLLLPAVVAVLPSALISFSHLLEGSGIEGFLQALAFYAFFGGLAVMATTVFSTELHERTVSLLLSQPIARSRVWWEKMLVLMLAIVVVVVLEGALLTSLSGWYSGKAIHSSVRSPQEYQGWVSGGLFLLGTACSCGFWTLVAGSTIGGVVFTISGQLLVALAAAFVASRIYGQDQLFQDIRTLPVVVAGALLYSAAFQYLGWRKFMRLELTGTTLSSKRINTAKILSWRPVFLQSRPTGKILNLMRKEVRLQKTVFQLSAVFTLGWLAIVSIQLLRPRDNITYLFDIVASLYAPITSLLASCVPLGEEKSLGLANAQLVLPVSARMQWLIKLAVSAAIAAALALGLPLLLFWATGKVINLSASGLTNPQDNGMLALAIISGFIFLLGYWAITLTTSTVRAALLAIFSAIALPMCAALAIHWGRVSAGASTAEQTSLSAAAAAASVLLLGQSLIQFCKSEQRENKLIVYATSVVGLVVVVAFLATCIG